MTLSQIIKLRTNSGRDVVDFLVDVMQDRYDDFRICHRLQAARLLTTYGNEDAPDFIADNTMHTSPDTRKREPRRPTRFDSELARVIREDTDDGRSIARFLVNVMEGELRSRSGRITAYGSGPRTPRPRLRQVRPKREARSSC